MRKCGQTNLSCKVVCTNRWILNRSRMLFSPQHIPQDQVEINPYENRGWRLMAEDFCASFSPFPTIGSQRSQEWLGYHWLPGLFRMESLAIHFPLTPHETRNMAKCHLDNHMNTIPGVQPCSPPLSITCIWNHQILMAHSTSTWHKRIMVLNSRWVLEPLQPPDWYLFDSSFSQHVLVPLFLSL